MQRRQSSFAAWPALGAAAAVVVLFGALAQVLEPVAAAAPPPLLLGGPHVGCASCGWIEAKRELVPLLAADPQALRVYEYTLRMQDGSMSVFQETLPTSWRLGEGVVLIEDMRPLD